MAPPLPPGSSAPAAVQLLEWVIRPLALLERNARRYGDAFTMRLPGLTGVVVSRPSTVKAVFTADPADVPAGEANRVVEGLLGQGSLLVLDGERHLRERRLLMPALHGERMRAYADAMRAVADEAIDRWPLGSPFALADEMRHVTLEVILRTVFGVTDAEARARLSALLTTLLAAAVHPAVLLLSYLVPPARVRQLLGTGSRTTLGVDLARWLPWAAAARAGAATDTHIAAQIAAHRREADHPADDVLSLLLAARDEHGGAMTDSELRDEMMTLLVAGHETTATALAWAFHHLLRDRRVLGRATDEVTRVAGGPGRAVPADRLAELTYLDAVIKETLRLEPIVPIVGRRLARPLRLDGIDLDAGVMVLPCIHLAHRRQDAWGPDAATFRPERFLDADGHAARIDPYAFFPFGGGSRRCIGMAFALYEMKVVLAAVLARVALRAESPAAAVSPARRGVIFVPSDGTRVVVAEKRPAS